MVKGKDNIPSELTELPLAFNIRLAAGQDIILIGFPRGVAPWAVIKGNISSRQVEIFIFPPPLVKGIRVGPLSRTAKSSDWWGPEANL